MSQKVICKFGKPFEKNRTQKEFTVFDFPGDSHLSDYPKFFIYHDNIKDIINKLSVGTWLQTIDNYLVPIIVKSEAYFRIPGGGSYRAYNMREGAYLYFKPPREYKTLITNQGKGKSLTTRQLAFCWAMAKKWNIVDAVYEAGYSCQDYRMASVIGGKLIIYDKIKKGIMSAIKTHCEALGLKEEELALNKMNGLLNSFRDLEQVLKSKLTDKITNNSVSKNDIDDYLKIAGKFSDEIKTAASWLNYDADAPIQIEGAPDGSSFEYKSIKAETVKSLPANGITKPALPLSYENLVETTQVIEKTEVNDE